MSDDSFPGDRLWDDDERAFRADFQAWLSEHPSPERPGTVDRVWMDEYCAWFEGMATAGFAALHWPVEYGGAERPVGHQLVQIEEFARTGTDPKPLMAGSYLIAPLLMELGSDEQKKHLPDILAGRERWSLMLSEPGAGSDLFSLTTRGEVGEQSIRLNGQKIWTSYGHVANYCMALIRTDPGSKRSRGLSLVIIDMTLAGITVRPIRQMNGEAEFNEVFLDDVDIPLSTVVGGLGEGTRSLIVLLSAERTGLAMAGYAMLCREAESLRAHVSASDDDDLQREWVKLWARIAAQRLTALRSGANLASPDGAFASASVVKLQNAMNAQALAALALRSKGVRGLVTDGDDIDNKVVNVFLRSPADSIGGGTSEVQMNAMAERILGLPR